MLTLHERKTSSVMQDYHLLLMVKLSSVNVTFASINHLKSVHCSIYIHDLAKTPAKIANYYIISDCESIHSLFKSLIELYAAKYYQSWITQRRSL